MVLVNGNQTLDQRHTHGAHGKVNGAFCGRLQDAIFTVDYAFQSLIVGKHGDDNVCTQRRFSRRGGDAHVLFFGGKKVCLFCGPIVHNEGKTFGIQVLCHRHAHIAKP